MQLRDKFFTILEHLAKVLAWLSVQDMRVKANYDLTRFIVSTFQWQFSARDFPLIHKRLPLFTMLHTEQSQMMADKSKSLLRLWLDPRTQLSKDLLITFQNLFFTVVKRITDGEAVVP